MIRFLQTPGPIKKVVLGGILVVISLAMLVYLIPNSGNQSFGNPNAHIVAQVDGQDISAEEVHQTAQRMLQQQMPQGGANMSMLLPFFASRAAEQLITRQALLTEARRMGLRVTPEEIRDEIEHAPAYAPTFFPGGNFIGEQEYEQILQQANFTPARFESSVGDDILISKLQALVAGTATVSETQIHDQFIKQNSKVKFDYAVLKQDDIKKGLHPTDQELKAYYDSHKASYANSIPEKRKVKYAVVDYSKAEEQVHITDADLRDYYDQHREQYRIPEQVKVSHILIKTPLPGPDGKVDEKGVAEAQQRAEDLLKQIKNGASFEELAKKYSEDPGSAKNGGSLGWVGRGQTVPEFEKVAFSLPKGQISGVVKSSYGFHIIRVDDKHEGELKPLDEVKSEIEPILKRQQAQQIAQDEAQKILNQAQKNGLDAAAAAQGVPVVTSDFFSRKDVLPGLGPAPQLMDSVFMEPDKAPPDMASSSEGVVVFQLLAIQPPSTPTFEAIQSRVEQEFKNERSNMLLSQKTQELSDRAKAEHDLKRAAKELGAAMKTSDFVLPDGQVPDIGSMTGQAAVAFTMKPGEISGPILSSGDGTVLQLIDNQKPPESEFASKRDEIRDQLLQSKQQELFELFASNLRNQLEKSGKIKINQEELKALTRTGTEEGM
jgi:peptidyl-prolyl cis-trans isomerase D